MIDTEIFLFHEISADIFTMSYTNKSVVFPHKSSTRTQQTQHAWSEEKEGQNLRGYNLKPVSSHFPGPHSPQTSTAQSNIPISLCGPN